MARKANMHQKYADFSAVTGGVDVGHQIRLLVSVSCVLQYV